jgi:hypothetical protein
MERMPAFARESLPLDRAALVIRESDPHVSSGGGILGWGPVVINYGPPVPISEAFLEMIREKIRASTSTPPPEARP